MVNADNGLPALSKGMAGRRKDQMARKQKEAAAKAPARRGQTVARPGVAVVVLGMHRSGTSAMARMLSLLGCDLPKTIMGANSTNQAGHWESQAIARLNDGILTSAGSSWDDWLEFNPEWMRSLKAEEFHDKAKAVLEEQFGSSRLFVLKDPRICRLPAFWFDVIRDKGLKPVAVIPLRNPLEVAASLQKRNGFDPALGQLLWLRHVLDAEYGSRGVPRYFTDFDRLMSNWAAVAMDAASALGISWPRLSNRAREEIDGFLDERYRHHREGHEKVLENRSLSHWLREAFAIFSRWAAEGEDKSDFSALDRIREEFTEAAPAFTRLVSSGRKAAEKGAVLEKRLAGLGGTLNEISVRLEGAVGADQPAGASPADGGSAAPSSVEEVADRLGTAVEASLVALRETRGRLAETESALRQRRHETEETAAELAAARDELQQLVASRGTDEKMVEGLKAHIDLLRRDLENRASTAQLEEKDALIAAARREKEEIAAELAAARDELQQLVASRGTDEKVVEGLKAHIDLLRRDLENRASTAQLEEKDALIAVAQEEKEASVAALAELHKTQEKYANEIAALRSQLDQADASAKQMRDAFDKEKQRGAAERANEITALRSQLDQAGASVKEMSAALDKERQRGAAERSVLEQRIGQRFDEIAALTRMLERNEALARVAGGEVRRAITGMLGGGKWPSILRRLQVRRQAKWLQRSGLFDGKWYLAQNADVAEAGADPARHYIEYGAAEGREPNRVLHDARMGTARKDAEGQ